MKKNKRGCTIELFEEGQIYGQFEGWLGESVYTIIEGHTWKQAHKKYDYQYSYHPFARVWHHEGRYFMQVLGLSDQMEVVRVGVESESAKVVNKWIYGNTERQWLWTWGGRCFGYRMGEDLWTFDGRHVGKFDGDIVFNRLGQYLGEIKTWRRLISSLSQNKRKSPPFSPKPRHKALAKYDDSFGLAVMEGYEDFPGPEAISP